MNDMFEQIYDALNVQVVTLIDQSKSVNAQNESMRDALSEKTRQCLRKDERIADLERQLAEASAPAVEQHSYEHQRAVLEGERNAAADDYFSARELLDLVQNRRIFDAGFDRGFTARHCAPQATDTDKVREALKQATEFKYVPVFKGATQEEQRSAFVELLMKGLAAQAPVREVPDMQKFMESAKAFAMAHINSDDLDARVAADMVSGKYTVTDEEHEAMDNAYNTTKAALVAAYRALPAAPVQPEDE